MLRKTIAKWLALATAVVVVVMAAAFATLHNVSAPDKPGPAAGAERLAQTDAKGEDPGQRAFVRLSCAMCHSLGGAGNPAGALDGVGARLNRAELRAWTTGTGAARERLPQSVVRRKAPAADAPDLEALLDYLQRSK